MKTFHTLVLSTIFAFGLSGVPPVASAQEEPLDPAAHTTRFFETMIKGIWREAPAEFFKGSELLERDPLAAEKVVQQLEAFGKQLGIPNGYEILEERTIGDSIVYQVYMLKFPVKPVIWEFIYYKFDDKWKLSTLNLPNNLEFVRQKK